MNRTVIEYPRAHPLVRHPAAILAAKVMIQRLREMPDHLRNQGPFNIRCDHSPARAVAPEEKKTW